MAEHGPAPNGHTPPKSRPKPPDRTGQKMPPNDVSQARALQTLAADVALSLRQDLVSATSSKARKEVSVALRQAIAAWEICMDRVRIARGKPLPGSMRPEAAKPKVAKPKSGAHWSEEPEAKPDNSPPETGG